MDADWGIGFSRGISRDVKERELKAGWVDDEVSCPSSGWPDRGWPG